MEQTGKFSNGRAALGLLALVILAAAQLGAQLLASLPLMVGAPVWLGNVLAGVLYAALGVAGLLLLCGKGLRVTPEECRFAPVRLRPVWAASAVLMPALAAGALLCQPGHWQAGSAEDATAGAAAVDLHACLDEPMVIPAGELAMVPTGLAVAIPEGCVGILAVRSSMGVRHGVTLSNGIGVIDSDYRGPLGVGLWNTRREDYTVLPGDRIAQLMVVPVLRPELLVTDALPETERGQGGFGSTGR